MRSDNSVSLRLVSYSHPDVTVLADEVQTYYASIYGTPDDNPILDAEFTPPEGAFFIGYDADVPVVMGGWRFHQVLPGIAATRPAEIRRMYVRESARRRGLARMVLRHLEETARAAGADAIVLETGQPQRDALALYLSSGYTRVQSFGHYADAPEAIHLGKMFSEEPLVD